MKHYNLDNVEISDIEFYKTNTGIIVWNNGDTEYRLNGKTHRIGGPALIVNEKTRRPRKVHYYFYCGKEVTKEQHDLLYNIMKLKGLL